MAYSSAPRSYFLAGLAYRRHHGKERKKQKNLLFTAFEKQNKIPMAWLIEAE